MARLCEITPSPLARRKLERLIAALLQLCNLGNGAKLEAARGERSINGIASVKLAERLSFDRGKVDADSCHRLV
jgi:hypothetical protein